MSEAQFDKLVNALILTESEMEADEWQETLAEARMLVSGVNRFYGDVDKQVRYMLGLQASMQVVSPEMAVLAAVEYADPQGEYNLRTEDALH